MKSRVIILQSNYERETLIKNLKKGIELLGGLKSLFPEKEKILIKPNMLSPDAPEKAVTTHPEVLAALFSILKREGFSLEFGDSPGLTKPLFTARKNGILAVAKEFKVEISDFEDSFSVKSPSGLLFPSYAVALALKKEPAIVSVSKMKTHGFMGITGAVKNHFGLIPGLKKGEFHFRLRTRKQFSQMLLDLHRIFPARLYIMDGIVAMEGNGPRSGNPRSMGVLLLSRDPVALDSTFCRLIDYPPENIPVLKLGQESGLGNWQIANTDYDGQNWQNFIQPDFKIDRRNFPETSEVKYPDFLRNRITPRPVLLVKNCSSCRQCEQICPAQPKAIIWKDKHPLFNYKNCIRCFCCQEICPSKAISISRPILHRFLFRKKQL